MILYCIIVFLTSVSAAAAYGSGAPFSTCESMTPGHAASALPREVIPYDIQASQDEVQLGQLINITISTTTEAFRGFLVQVRDEEDLPVGSFEIAADDTYTQTLNCNFEPATAVTHKNNLNKDGLVFPWRAPDVPGDYRIVITIAQNYAAFWVLEEFQTITVA